MADYRSNGPWLKKALRRLDVRDAGKRLDDGEPLPGDDELIMEEALRSSKVWAIRFARAEKKYAALPPEQRVRYDVREGRFFRECMTYTHVDEKGRRVREAERSYLKSSTEPEYLHAFVKAINDAEAEEELERINAARAYLSMIGRRGGQQKSAAKTRAARANAKLPRRRNVSADAK